MIILTIALVVRNDSPNIHRIYRTDMYKLILTWSLNRKS